MTISQRRDRLRRRLVAAELDAMLVTDLVNVRYLSGFTGSNAALLVRAKLGIPPKARTDPREEERTGTPLYECLAPEEWRKSQWDFIWLKSVAR